MIIISDTTPLRYLIEIEATYILERPAKTKGRQRGLQRNAFNGEPDGAQTATGLGELITARSWLLGTLPEMLN